MTKVSDEVLRYHAAQDDQFDSTRMARELLELRAKAASGKPIVAWVRDCGDGISVYPYPDRPKEHAPTVGDDGRNLWRALVYAAPEAEKPAP